MNFNNIKNNKGIKTIAFILLGIFVFSTGYFLSYNYNLKKVQEVNGSSIKKEANNIKNPNTTVLFARRTLDDAVVIDYKTTIGEITKKEGITDDEVEAMVEEMALEGYELVSSENGEMVFLNDMNILEAGKYYIGEKDGYIAMFKADSKGVPTIEKPEDVSTKKIEDLPEVDRDKIINFEKKYDTREECEEHMTNYIS